MNVYDKIVSAVAAKNWDEFIDVLKPKHFPRDEAGTLIDKKIFAKVAELLTAPRDDVPASARIVLTKCLVNSCVEGYKHEPANAGDESSRDYSHESYRLLSNADDSSRNFSSFPYNGVTTWAADYLIKYVQNIRECSKDEYELLRLNTQFLCNLVTFACDHDNLPRHLNSDDFKAAIITLTGSDEVPLARAACAYVHNALKQLPINYFHEAEMHGLAQPLIKADQLGIQSAEESLIFLLKRPDWLHSVYDNLSIESKLYLLEIIHQDVRSSAYSGGDNKVASNFPPEVIQFLSERFRKRSDLILKTVDSYLNGMEPMEITLLLDIICVISSEDSLECHLLQNDKSLLINCIFLLKSLHMAGRASDNFFTPLQKLSDIAPSNTQAGSSTDENDIQNHPAFGFKAGLIRAIGNLCHKHKGNQELMRETDAIPLLLDCCNIDARNPLIMQWTIFALKNLCDDSPENQEVIRSCNKVGVVDNVVLREMGLKLHEGEDGKAIGILPLPRNK